MSVMYINSLLVYPEPLGESINVTCIAIYEGVYYSDTVILQGTSQYNMSLICLTY